MRRYRNLRDQSVQVCDSSVFAHLDLSSPELVSCNHDRVVEDGASLFGPSCPADQKHDEEAAQCHLGAMLRAAEADGIAVPETPVFASSPGILLHQHRKMLENVEETQKQHVKNDEHESRDCEKDKIVLEGTVKTKAQIEKAWKICYFSLDAHGTVRYFDMEDDLNKSKSPMASFSCHGLKIVKTRYKDEKYQFTAVVSKFVSICQPTSDILMKHPDDQKCLEFAFETEGDHAAWLIAFTRMTNGGADNLQCLQGKSDCNKKKMIEEPNADIQALRVSSADSETEEVFKRVSSSERLADRESKISALLELDGVECVGSSFSSSSSSPHHCS